MSKLSAKKHADLAKAHFLQGYNCAQSTVAAFAEDFGLDSALLLKMTAGLGAGVGGLRQTCGPVSAMAMLAGLSVGGYPPEDLAAKATLYDIVKRMRAEFVNRHGSDCCRELLERASIVPGATPSQRTPEYYEIRPCAGLVASGAEIIARTLLAKRQGD
jgi:C_GCAxxG_C_C family probable redox protein